MNDKLHDISGLWCKFNNKCCEQSPRSSWWFMSARCYWTAGKNFFKLTNYSLFYYLVLNYPAIKKYDNCFPGLPETVHVSLRCSKYPHRNGWIPVTSFYVPRKFHPRLVLSQIGKTICSRHVSLGDMKHMDLLICYFSFSQFWGLSFPNYPT